MKVVYGRKRIELTALEADPDFAALPESVVAKLSENEKEAVLLNESARIFMRRSGFCPTFSLTAEQNSSFASYGPMDSIKATIAARILSGDPSALKPTEEQFSFVRELRGRMGLSV